jgi:hypothetical protein
MGNEKHNGRRKRKEIIFSSSFSFWLGEEKSDKSHHHCVHLDARSNVHTQDDDDGPLGENIRKKIKKKRPGWALSTTPELF